MSIVAGIDFDGTMVKFAYPRIGAPVPQAIRVMKRMMANRIFIFMYTMRGEESGLLEAEQWCKDVGIKLIGVNKNPLQKFQSSSPKIFADFYVDDSAMGTPLIKEEGQRPYVDWMAIENILEARGFLDDC